MTKVFLALLLSFASAAVIAGDEANQPGKADFVAYCASCHGVDGTGNGPLAPALKIPASDLTVISKKNKGQFPYTLIRKTIESQELGLARAHGPREMPVWGPVFSQEPEGPVPGGPSGAFYGLTSAQCVNLAAKAKVMNIVDYIESIQQK